MSGLFGTLDVALQSLLTQQGALRATTDNIGNLNTVNILNQTGISALAQANQMQQGVLSLLR